MTAKLATGEDRIWAGVEEAGALRDGSILLHSASDTPQLGSMQFGCGYLSPYFVTDPGRMEVVFEDVYIFIHEKRLSSKSDLIPLLEQITESGKPLLIIAEDVGAEALATLVVNKLRGPLQVAAVRAPGSGDQRKRMLQNIALLTGCKFITEDLDTQLRNIQISDLGQAKKITIDKNCTVIEGRTKYDRPPLNLGPAIAEDLKRGVRPIKEIVVFDEEEMTEEILQNHLLTPGRLTFVPPRSRASI